MKRSGLVTDGTPDEFEALAGRCAVFRFDPPDYRCGAFLIGVSCVPAVWQ